MRPALPRRSPQALFDVAATRRLETSAQAALPPHTLMQRAGLAAARLALALAPHARRVWVAAGPGNNGGDGFEAALHLATTGRAVQVTWHGRPELLPDDARASHARALAAGVAIGPEAPAPLEPEDIALDALLGIGARRAPEGELAQAVRRLAGLPCPVLSIDLPSGLDADRGQPLGEPCVRADHTLSLLTLKPGLFTAAGRDHAGRVWFDDLGVASSDVAPAAWLAGESVLETAPRRHAQHKGSFGDVAVVGGAPGMTGAALLAGRAALAAGAGRVYVELLDGGSLGVDPRFPELMLRAGWSRGARAALAASTVVCGCGGAEAVREVLPRLLAAVPRLVLDADALNAIAADASLRTLLAARADHGAGTVLTPHPLEAARLLGSDAAAVQADRLAAARQLADRLRCTVLLKGSGTVVATPGQVPWINPTGNPSLASAGTGDVLAGWIGGDWSARGSTDAAATATAVAIAAAYRHGAAADAAGRRHLRASALIEVLTRR